MSFLGDLGSLYMLVLIALLIIGLGMIAKGFFDYLLNRETKNIGKRKGENNVQRIPWLKLSLYSMIGIIVSFIMLSFITSTGLGVNNSAVNHSTALSNSTALGTSSVHGSSSMNNTNAIGTTNLGNVSAYNYYQLQQQFSQMQQQINQLQSMLQNRNSSQTTTTPGTSNANNSMPKM